jgi:hypothetical protein
MKNDFNVGDILLDKIVPSGRLLVIKKHEQEIECVFLDGYMANKKVFVRNLFTYKKVGFLSQEEVEKWI